MRKEPTLRIPLGMLGLVAVLMVYGGMIAHYVAPLMASWNGLAQAPVYIALGLVWLLPLKRFLIWMETGRWRAGE
jgi:hypothetical protein